MKEYKVITTEGKEVMVSKEHAEHLMHDVWEDSDKRHEMIAKYLEDYKKRAEHNINKVANEDRDELTEDDIKREITEYFHDDRIAELLVEAMEFMGAKLAYEIHSM